MITDAVLNEMLQRLQAASVLQSIAERLAAENRALKNKRCTPI